MTHLRLLLLVLVFAVVGCSVTPEDWNRCVAACKSNGGPEYYHLYPAGLAVCVCKNGARFNR